MQYHSQKCVAHVVRRYYFQEPAHFREMKKLLVIEEDCNIQEIYWFSLNFVAIFPPLFVWLVFFFFFFFFPRILPIPRHSRMRRNREKSQKSVISRKFDNSTEWNITWTDKSHVKYFIVFRANVTWSVSAPEWCLALNLERASKKSV